jgi:hypothetical protein
MLRYNTGYETGGRAIFFIARSDSDVTDNHHEPRTLINVECDLTHEVI